jgi:hypothetical protein
MFNLANSVGPSLDMFLSPPASIGMVSPSESAGHAGMTGTLDSIGQSPDTVSTSYLFG